MAHYKVDNTGLPNELLTLWLKARDGLSCEEARELIERLARTEQEAKEDAQQAEDDIRGMRDAEAMLQSAESERDELRGVVQRLHGRINQIKKDVSRALS